MKTKILIIGLLMFSFINTIKAQNGISLGLGGYTAVSRGIEAVYWNPANLAIIEKNNPRLEIKLFSINAGGGNNAFDFDYIKQYIGDGEAILITEENKIDILDKINDDGLKIDLAAQISAFSFRYKNFGVSIESHSYGYITIPKDLYRTVLTELGPDNYDYSVDGEGYTYGKMKLSYARAIIKNKTYKLTRSQKLKLKAVTFGISMSYLHGMGHAKIEESNATIDINKNGILPKIDYMAKRAMLGDGFGLDLGFGIFTEDNWSFGFVFENLMSSINWTYGQHEETGYINFGPDHLFIFGDNQLDDIDMDTASKDTSIDIDEYSTDIPVDFRMGLAKDFGNILLNMEIAKENKTSSFALGGMVKLGIFNWAMSWKREENHNRWSTGWALAAKYFYLDIGMSGRSGFSLLNAKAVNYGMSLCFGL